MRVGTIGSFLIVIALLNHHDEEWFIGEIRSLHGRGVQVEYGGVTNMRPSNPTISASNPTSVILSFQHLTPHPSTTLRTNGCLFTMILLPVGYAKLDKFGKVKADFIYDFATLCPQHSHWISSSG